MSINLAFSARRKEARTNERVLISELKIERDEVEEADESSAENGAVGDKAGRNEGVSSDLALVKDESDQDDRAYDQHGDDLAAAPWQSVAAVR